MTLVSPHFSLRELTVTSKVDPTGKLLPNMPDEMAVLYLRVLAETMLEPIRKLWGCGVQVNSAYRSPTVEMAVSGKRFGQHMLGQAADIVPLGGALDLDEAYKRVYTSGLPFDQLLLEADHGVRWIHVSIAPVLAEPRGDAFVTLDGGESWGVYHLPEGSNA